MTSITAYRKSIINIKRKIKVLEFVRQYTPILVNKELQHNYFDATDEIKQQVIIFIQQMLDNIIDENELSLYEIRRELERELERCKHN